MNTTPARNPGINQPNSQQNMAKSHSVFLSVDVPLLLVVICLLVFGLLMVYSSSWGFAISQNQDTSSVALRQVIWVVVGAIFVFLLSHYDYHKYQRWLMIIMGGSLLMLFFVLWASNLRFGATRTLLGGSIQPSELAKLATIIYLSFWLYSKRDKLKDFSIGLLPMAVILGVTSGMILLQPDLSAAFTVIIIGGILFFLAGGELKQIAVVSIIAALMIWLIITVSDTGRSRLQAYLLGLQSPADASYHVRRSMESVVRGGWFGVGIGNGSTKITGLPVPWTDSIFAVIAEETGLMGAVTIVGLYMVFLWRGLKIAQRAPDILGKLLASGITLWITLEAIINMGVLVNLFPFAGNALPLISAGGSSMVTAMLGIGILMNISRMSSYETNTQERSISGATVNLRWRDRRRGVSRTRRSTNAQ